MPVAAVAGRAQVLVAGGLRPQHVDLAAGDDLERDPVRVQPRLQRADPSGELADVHAREVLAQVRGRRHHAHAGGERLGGERERARLVGRTVVETGQQVGVEIDHAAPILRTNPAATPRGPSSPRASDSQRRRRRRAGAAGRTR